MPIYEYQCQKCKKVHEIWQKITEDPATKCPDCKGKLERLISHSGFALKGSGWYKDGYGSSSRKSDSGGEKKAGDSKAEASSASKSESKSETKAESKSESKSEGGAADKKTHKSNSPVRKD
jgi:putative FmdB family regulatory protein